ncbi:14928_t:CDS:2, partial [Cetraspora pellucida]
VFNSWDVAIEEIEKYACCKGFGTRRLCVEKLENGDVQRCTIVCEHFGCPEQTKSKNSQNKTTSKHIGCTWQINISYPEKENPHRLIYVTKIVDKHKNHELNPPYLDWDPNTKCLHQLFYMSPEQIELWLKFNDVVLNDCTVATNCYKMALSIFLIVDNYLHLCMVVQALIDDEMMESHSWIFQNIKNATRNAVSHAIFTDVDLAVSAAIRDEFSTTKSLHCMFHISQNLFSNLKSCLGNQYNEFIQDFYEMQKSLFEVIFEYKWIQLVNKYNNNKIVSYLQRALYSSKETWTKAFVLTSFTAEMSSTSRVESYNAKIKCLIFNTNTILLRLADVLSTCIYEEDIKTEYFLFHASVLRATLFSIAETILPNVCQLLKKYLTEEAQKIQENQIIQALHYHVNLNNSNLFNNENLTTIIAKASLDLVDTRKARAATLLAIKNRDNKLIEILDEYLKEQQVEKSNVDNDEESCNESDKENFSAKDLVNSHKHKGKGRPKKTDRKQCTYEPPKKSKKQKFRCGICNGLGHNRRSCEEKQ